MKRILITTVLALALLSSCVKKYENPTQAQLTARKLITELGSASGYSTSNGKQFSVFNNGGNRIFAASFYNITPDGFISLSESNQSPQVYNLAFLKSYQVSGVNVYLFFSY